MRARRTPLVLGGVALAGLVGYLLVTGMRDAMLYYLTPAELLARVERDAGFYGVGVKVGGRVAPGSVRYDPATLRLAFDLVDIERGQPRIPVRYEGPLPDTFGDGRDVVVEGRLDRDGVFRARTVLTKCGSRYEAYTGEGR